MAHWRAADYVSANPIERQGSQMTEPLRADCVDATPFRGFSAHRPRGSLAPRKEDCPWPGEKRGGVPAPSCSCPPGR